MGHLNCLKCQVPCVKLRTVFYDTSYRTLDTKILIFSVKRADGGIGIRACLRSMWGNPWRFKSSSAHHPSEIIFYRRADVVPSDHCVTVGHEGLTFRNLRSLVTIIRKRATRDNAKFCFIKFCGGNSVG